VEEEAAVEVVQVHTQNHVCVGQEEVGSVKLLGWQHLMVVERGADEDMLLLLSLQGAVLAAVAVVAAAGVLTVAGVAAAEADFEAVGVVPAVATALVAEVVKREVEWTEPIFQSVTYKANA
jgi:hypothetical protein